MHPARSAEKRRILLALLLWFPVTTIEASDNLPEFEPCFLSGSAGTGSIQAECATWVRPTNPSDPDGEQVPLFVARLPSTAINPAADALTVINGGPGGSSIDMLVDMAGAIKPFTRERDVVVIDQRGTGRSTPLSCDALTDTTETPDLDTARRLTKECLASLPYDPRYFSTSVAVRDLEALRESLGYQQLSLYGVSYGTRVAMHYMRRFPDRTRAVVVDGVVPPTFALGANIAIRSQITFDTLLARCAADQHCDATFPDLRVQFERVKARLTEQPLPLELRHPVTGLPTEIELTYGHLAIWVRLALYAPETSALIPLIIHQAAVEENYLPIAANALNVLHQLNESMQYGMHNAVVCTEDAPFFEHDAVAKGELEATYLGRDIYDALAVMCSVWPAGVMDEDMKAPLESDIPTLVLSGEFDPITPPDYGEAIMPGLSNATHIVAPGQGHGVLPRGCIPRIALEFVEQPDPKAVDASCTEHLGTFPFFVDLMGPTP